MKMLSASQQPQRKRGVSAALLSLPRNLHRVLMRSRKKPSDGAVLLTFLQTYSLCCSDMKGLDVQMYWWCCCRTQILHSQSSLALSLIRQSATAPCENLQSFTDHSGLPRRSFSSFGCRERRYVLIRTNPLNSDDFFNFPWCQFP